MSPRAKWIASLAASALCVALLAGGVLAVAWSGLPIGERGVVRASLSEHAGALILVAVLLATILGMLLHALVRAYVARPLQLAEETQLMLEANPRHRLDVQWPRELAQFATAVNALAARYESMQREVDQRVREAQQALEAERNLLAALMADLTESVIVCNAAGTILLCNERARQLFAATKSADDAAGADLIGLGRSLFNAIEREVLAHAIDHLHHRLREGDAAPIAEFVTASRGGRLLRGRMRAVGTASTTAEQPGFVLVLDDVRGDVNLGAERERLMRTLTEGTRASLASIRAAAEAVMHYPAMDLAQQRKFLDVIHDEAERLGSRLETSFPSDTSRLSVEWPLATMLGSDLLGALKRNLEMRCQCAVSTDGGEEPLWLNADSFLLVEGLTDLLQRAQRTCGVTAVALRLAQSGSRIQLEVGWSGDALSVEQVLRLEQDVIAVPGHPRALSFNEIVARHGGEAWYQREADGRSVFRLLLPAAEVESHAVAADPAGSRPVFYDFDLFHQRGHTPEIDQRCLSELAYTVFDTETTGLQPSQGDEILAIAAVRVVNQRLLVGEAFDRLVNPRRPVPGASVRVHRLSREILEGEPGIETILPQFHRYCEHSVLVAHNAAFDMRFLQLKEQQVGLKFNHPVLDTMLLSAVVHPHQTDHSLEAIAARLGVSVIGRHTALGDAIVAGEIFLKLIGLLRQQGIVTFRQAHDAQQRTPLARLNY